MTTTTQRIMNFKEEGQSLLEIKAKFPRWMKEDSNYGHSLSHSDVRRKLEKDFDVNATYLFVRTIAKEKAMDEISAHSKELLMDGRDPEEFSEAFDAKIMEMYLDILDTRLKKKGVFHERYSLIDTRGNRLYEEPSWPIIHVVKEETTLNEFASFLEELQDEEAYKYIKRRESPQNYHIKVYTHLHKNQIQPVVLDERTWKVKGDELRNALDFLSCFSYSKTWMGGPSIEVD